MPKPLSQEKLIGLKELLKPDMIEIQTIARLLYEMGVITQGEYEVPDSLIGG